MARNEAVVAILQQVHARKLSPNKAMLLLSTVSGRKLRGVTVSESEEKAYAAFKADGDFRQFCITLGLPTNLAQNALGRLARHEHETIAETEEIAAE